MLTEQMIIENADLVSAIKDSSQHQSQPMSQEDFLEWLSEL